MARFDAVLRLSATTVAQFSCRIPLGAEPPVALAAEELTRCLGRMLCHRIKLEHDADLPRNVLVLRAEYTTFDFSAADTLEPQQSRLHVQPDGLWLQGGSAQGLLFGVYRVLRECGCRWLSPFEDEVVPTSSEVVIPAETRTFGPALARRGLGEDARAITASDPASRQAFVNDTVLVLRWMARLGMSHFTSTATWLRGDPEIVAALRDTGIVAIFGGIHSIPRLLPRDLFDTHPEWFPLDATGVRNRDGNLCVSNDAALAQVVVNAVAEVIAAGEPEFYSVQGVDLPDGAWCCCPDCAGCSPTEQNLRVCEAVAAGLGAAGLTQTQVTMVAYQSTLQPVDQPGTSTLILLAPRERSYAEPIDAPANGGFADALQGWSESLAPGRLGFIEYYTDSIRFADLSVPMTRVIAADLKHYRAHGATAWARTLFMGRGGLQLNALNAWVFARLCWDPEQDVEELVREFCAARYGADGERIAAWFAALEHALASAIAGPDIESHTMVTTTSLERVHQVELSLQRLDAVVASGRALRRIIGTELAAAEKAHRYLQKHVQTLRAIRHPSI